MVGRLASYQLWRRCSEFSRRCWFRAESWAAVFNVTTRVLPMSTTLGLSMPVIDIHATHIHQRRGDVCGAVFLLVGHLINIQIVLM